MSKVKQPIDKVKLMEYNISNHERYYVMHSHKQKPEELPLLWFYFGLIVGLFMPA